MLKDARNTLSNIFEGNIEYEPEKEIVKPTQSSLACFAQQRPVAPDSQVSWKHNCLEVDTEPRYTMGSWWREALFLTCALLFTFYRRDIIFVC